MICRKKVLVTGSAGFIGSHIVKKLTEQQYYVIEVDTRDVHPQDARDFFRNDCSWEHIDLIIHCAAKVGGRVLIETPMAHAENLEIDAALFQWAERAKPGRIVYISSVAAYPVILQSSGARSLAEDDINLTDIILPPDELYGFGKLTGEFLASRSSVPVSIPRPFTVYGEGQDPVFPFANLIMQVKNYHDPVTVWGSGNQVRDFIHVEDVVNSILIMAEQGIDGPVNLCTGTGTSLNELAALIVKTAGSCLSLKNYRPEVSTLPEKTEGLPYRVGNPAKLHEFYIPKISLEDGIRKGLRA